MVLVLWTDLLSCIQIHTQVLEMAHPNIYPIYDLLECLKGSILQTIAVRYLPPRQEQDIGEECQRGSSFDGWPKPEALKVTSNSLYNEHLQLILFGQKDKLHAQPLTMLLRWMQRQETQQREVVFPLVGRCYKSECWIQNDWEMSGSEICIVKYVPNFKNSCEIN